MRKRSLTLRGAWLAMEAQQVIALRMMKLAMGGPAAKREARPMVAEKAGAATKASAIVAKAAMRGAKDGGAGSVTRMLWRHVKANRKRLAFF